MHVYALIEEGRMVQRCLTYTSDCRHSLHDLTPDTENRDKPFSAGTRFAAGNIFDTVLSKDGKLLQRAGAGPLASAMVGSLVIKRTRLITGNEKEKEPSAGPGWGDLGVAAVECTERLTETFVPDRVLHGLIPDCLLEEYQFWKTGPRTLRGYPRVPSADNETELFVRLQCQVMFRDPTSAAADPVPAIAVDCEPTELGSAVKARLHQKVAFLQSTAAAASEVKVAASAADTDYTGRPVPDAVSVLDAGVGQWVAIIKRVPAPPSGESKQGKSGVASSHVLNQPMVLLNLVRAGASNPMLRRLAQTLTRLDNLSHVLVWSHSDARAAGEECELTLVELPRLKLRFSVKQVDEESSGSDSKTPPKKVVRLYSLDYAGQFVAEQIDPSIEVHLRGIPHALVLENARHELSLLVPNYGMYNVRDVNLLPPF